MKHYFISAVVCCFVSAISLSLAAANPNAATITRAFGNVRILTNPTKTLTGNGAHALYEGMYYLTKPAKVGDKVEQGNILQTFENGRVRLVYDNGDQISISPSSSYQVRWDANKPDAKPMVDVLMGKFRAVIRKGGPRSGMQVSTRTMAMGVRGTDFFVTAREKNGESKVSVLRGVVAIKPKDSQEKPVEVPAGFSAEVPPAPPKTAKGEAVKPKPINVQRTTKLQIVQIQQESVLKKAEKDQLINNPEATKLLALEKKAVENTLEDMKATDPTLVASITEADIKSNDVDRIQTKALGKIFKESPQSQSDKPSKEELNLKDDDIYEKYFRVED